MDKGHKIFRGAAESLSHCLRLKGNPPARLGCYCSAVFAFSIAAKASSLRSNLFFKNSVTSRVNYACRLLAMLLYTLMSEYVRGRASDRLSAAGATNGKGNKNGGERSRVHHFRPYISFCRCHLEYEKFLTFSRPKSHDAALR